MAQVRSLFVALPYLVVRIFAANVKLGLEQQYFDRENINKHLSQTKT